MSPFPRNPFTAAILAGGESRRMGTDKAWVRVDGHPLWHHQMARLQACGASEILISVRTGMIPSFPPQMPALLIEDHFSGAGPLGGIEACLRAASHESLFVLAVDLPAMSVEYLDALMAQAKPGLGVLAEHQGFFEPLASLYPKSALEIAQALLAEGQYTLQRLAALCLERSLASKWVVPHEFVSCLTNWNFPTDWTQRPAPPLPQPDSKEKPRTS